MRYWLPLLTYAPRRLPAPLRRPLFGYAGGTLLAGSALLPEYCLSTVFPAVDFLTALSYMVVVGSALTWGVASGFCASLVSALGINYFVLAPHLAWNLAGLADAAGLVISFTTFGSLSMIASLAEGRRWRLISRQVRLEALQTLTAALSAARTPEDVGDVVARDGTRGLDAAAAIVRIVSADGEWLERVDAEAGGSYTWPYQRIWIDSPDRLSQGYPALVFSPITDGPQALACVPLWVEKRLIGVLVTIFSQPRCFTADERNLLRTTAELTAQALDRARQYLLEREHVRVAEELAGLHRDLVTTVSHELRTPLTAILGLAELLQDRWDQLTDARKRERIAQIAQAANRQARLVEDLLLISRMDGGAIRLNRAPVAMLSLVERAAAEVRASYPGQRVELLGDATVEVLVDPERLLQVLANLIDNAAKYSAEGTPVSVVWRLTLARAVARAGSSPAAPDSLLSAS